MGYIVIQYNGIYNLLNVSDVINEFIPGNVSDTDSVIDEEMTFTLDFDPTDIGEIYNLQVFLTAYTGLPPTGGSTDGAYSDFYNSFVVTDWSDGLVSLDGLTVDPALPGDFDNDGDVDGADFLHWQLNDGGQSGLADWQATFGDVVSPMTAASTGVPEPAAGLMLMLGMASLLFQRHLEAP